jgi:glyoxylase-like metal-dependent hydrolase (beta-lactamase superfamily II)
MAVASDYLESRQLGDVTVTAINDGAMPLTVDLTVTEDVWREELEADAEGKIPVDIHVMLVQTADATILIDAGLDEPGSRSDQRFLNEQPGSIRTPGVLAGLAGLGVKPQDVTHILVTHNHFHHVEGLAAEQDGGLVPRYPDAYVVLGRADWENASEEHLGPEQRARIGAVADAGLLELIDAEREIVPGVTMIPAPGETPGHSMIRISSDRQTLYAVGDVFHYAAEVSHPDWMPVGADQERLRGTRRKLLDDAISTDALVVFSHENFPPWGRIVENKGSGVRWQRA